MKANSGDIKDSILILRWRSDLEFRFFISADSIHGEMIFYMDTKEIYVMSRLTYTFRKLGQLSYERYMDILLEHGYVEVNPEVEI